MTASNSFLINSGSRSAARRVRSLSKVEKPGSRKCAAMSFQYCSTTFARSACSVPDPAALLEEEAELLLLLLLPPLLIEAMVRCLCYMYQLKSEERELVCFRTFSQILKRETKEERKKGRERRMKCTCRVAMWKGERTVVDLEKAGE